MKKKYPITEEAVEYFTNPDFISIVMLNDYDSANYGKALSHLCYGNKKLSKRICEQLLRAMVTTDYQRIDSYLNAIQELLNTQDVDPKTG